MTEKGRVEIDDGKVILGGDCSHRGKDRACGDALVGYVALAKRNGDGQRNENLGVTGQVLVSLHQVVESLLETGKREDLGRRLAHAPVVTPPRSDNHDVGKKREALLVASAHRLGWNRSRRDASLRGPGV